MVKEETTGGRPSNYSLWHRTLPKKCYVMDIDWVECREGFIPKALIETSEINYEYVNEGEDPYKETLWYVLRRTWLQRSALHYIAAKLGIKAYIVIHEPVPKPEKFLVLEITQELNSLDWKNSKPKDVERLSPVMLSESDYRKFLIGLERHNFFNSFTPM